MRSPDAPTRPDDVGRRRTQPVLVSILGPVMIEGVEALQSRDRVVLGVLVVRSPGAAAVDDIASALWGDDVPESCRKVIQGCVVRLRRALGRDAIRTFDGGYALDDEFASVDAHLFDSMLAEARAHLVEGHADRAVQTARSALGLWRGEPLADLDGWAPAEAVSRRLVAVHEAAEDLLLEARLRAGQFDTLAADAERLVQETVYREGRWMLWARVLYATDRQADALEVLRRLARTLREELGVEPSAEAVALELAILRQDPELIIPIAIRPDAPCPWPGLLPYEQADAQHFFGRDADVQVAVERLRSAGGLVVVGRSGVGKSSFVRAGVLPRLLAEGDEVIVITPDTAQAVSLAQVPDRVFVVVDQAEELVTQQLPAVGRTALLELLNRRAGRRVVLVARADLLDELTSERSIADLLERGLFVLPPLDAAGVRAGIEGPAARGGISLEPGLVELMVEECGHQPGSLPLLSHALVETWHRAEGNLLTVDGYRAAGGIRAAIATSAETVYSELDDSQRVQMRRLFRRLVRFEGDEPVRTRVPGSVADRLLTERLLAARLLVASDDGSLQIAHEQLARHWPRLMSWAAEDREGDRLLRHLSDEAQEWAASGRPTGLLYSGVRLAAAVEWTAVHSDELDDLERAYVEESVLASHSELRRARRTNSRLRLALSVTGLLLAVSVSLTAFAIHQRSTARAARVAAQSARDNSDALRFGAEAEIVEDPSLALLLVAQALSVDDSAAVRRQALEVFGRFRSLESTGQSPPGTDWPNDIPRAAGGVVAQTSDGVLVAKAERAAVVLTNSIGEQVGVIDALPATPNALAFDPTGRLLAAGFSEEGFVDAGTTIVWDVAHRTEIARFDAGGGQVWAHWFDPDGGSIYSYGADGLHQWDLTGARAIIRTGAGVPMSFRAGDTILSMPDATVDVWISEACRLSGRSLTEAEWRTFIGEQPYDPAC